MQRPVILVAAALVLSCVSTAPLFAAEPKKLAFVVGVAEYHKDGFTNLQFADDDAEALQRVLKQMGFEVEAVLREEATLERLKTKLAAFVEKTKGLSKQDLVFVSLCGHGIQIDVDRDGRKVSEAFFCPYDARKTDASTLLSINELMSSLERESGSSQNLLAIDACRDDPTRGGRGLDGSTVKELPAKLSVLFACSSGQRSYESEKVKHGIFTYVLLDGLNGGAANKRGEIAWINLAAHCATEVPRQVAELIPEIASVQRPSLLQGNLNFHPIFFLPNPLKPLSVHTNSQGMKLVLIPAGEFLMGSPETELENADKHEADESPQHRVRITKPFYLGSHEVTRRQFAQFVAAESYRTEAERDGQGGYGLNAAGNLEQKPEYTWRNLGFQQDDDHPVVNVSWNDAVAYCEWLSGKEGKTYRLPTEAEWEYACRAGTTTKYYHGSDPEGLATIGNVADGTLKAKHPRLTAIDSRDGYVHTAPVGRFKPNAWGLYDLHGNVREWCGDWYGEKYYGETPLSDPSGPFTGSDRVLRGGSWLLSPAYCRSAYRNWDTPAFRSFILGFRVALLIPELASVQRPSLLQGNLNSNPIFFLPSALKPLSIHTNSLAMKLVLIPSGEFLMGTAGSTDDESPQHRVRITKPYYLGQTEVTQGQWESVMGSTPWKRRRNVKEGSDYAASYVSWDDATEFCRKLSAREGKTYRLPTEAEWEYACRAGTTTVFHFGDYKYESPLSDYAWWGGVIGEGNARNEPYAHAVGGKRANAWGLYDLHGNVWEWCGDWHGEKYYGESPLSDPSGPLTGSNRVFRGGSWGDSPKYFRSAVRGKNSPTVRFDILGFRVALIP